MIIATITDVRIKGSASSRLAIEELGGEDRRHKHDAPDAADVISAVLGGASEDAEVGACSCASRCDGESVSTSCIPAVESTAVKYFSTVKTSSCVLYSNAAKFSAM